MRQEIEIEFKNMLTEEEFDALLKALPFPKHSIIQKNHYFETKNFSLKNNGAALRIREKNGVFVLTLKEPHPQGLLETHEKLTAEEAQHWLGGKPVLKLHITKRLETLDVPIKDFQYYGCLTTERWETTYKEALLVLDRSEYNGITDYELELEVKDRNTGILLFDELLREYNIEKKPSPNKIVRYFKSLPAGGK